MLVIPAFWRQEFKVIVGTHSELKARPRLKEGGKEGGGRGQEKSPARHGRACL